MRNQYKGKTKVKGIISTKLSVLVLLTMVPCMARSQQISKTTEISSHWEYTHSPYCQTDNEALTRIESATWRKAVVPGDVHLDLQRDGILPDCFTNGQLAKGHLLFESLSHNWTSFDGLPEIAESLLFNTLNICIFGKSTKRKPR